MARDRVGVDGLELRRRPVGVVRRGPCVRGGAEMQAARVVVEGVPAGEHGGYVVSSATRRVKVAIGESTPARMRKTSICWAMLVIGTSFTSARYLSHCLM